MVEATVQYGDCNYRKHVHVEKRTTSMVNDEAAEEGYEYKEEGGNIDITHF